MDCLTDRSWDYFEFSTGEKFRKDAEGLFPYQRDCVDFLFRNKRVPTEWRPEHFCVVQPPLGSDLPGRVGKLVANVPLPGRVGKHVASDYWEVTTQDSPDTEFHPATELWCPLSGRPTGAAAVYLPPGYGKTAIATKFICSLPPKARVLYLTKAGLLRQTEAAILSWGTRPPNLVEKIADFHALVNGDQLADNVRARERGFILATYTVCRGAALRDGIALFDVIVFDEAHTELNTIVNMFPRRDNEWQRPYPRIVLLSGSPETMCARPWCKEVISDTFYMARSEHAAMALGMQGLLFRIEYIPPPRDFDVNGYILRFCDWGALGRNHCFAIALLLWAYFKKGIVFSPSQSKAIRDKLLHAMLARFTLQDERASLKRRREYQRRTMSNFLISGAVFIVNCLSNFSHDSVNCVEWIQREAGDLATDLGPLPPSKRIDCSREVPLWETRLFRLCPKMAEWKKAHEYAVYGPGFSHGHTEELRRVAIRSLRSHRGEAVPKILLCNPLHDRARRMHVLDRLLNVPRRTQLCPVIAHPEHVGCGCLREVRCLAQISAIPPSMNFFLPCGGMVSREDMLCGKSHEKTRFRKDGKLRNGARWLLSRKEQRAIHGIQDEPGLEASLVYIISPDMSDKERADAIGHFNKNCNSLRLSLWPLLRQAEKKKGSASPFLRIILTADVYETLVSFLDVPQLCIAFGETMTLGFNGQERFNGLVIPNCEFDYETVMQKVGRLQRPCRDDAHAGELISVVMPATKSTVEELILVPAFQSSQVKADARTLQISCRASKAEIEAAMRKVGQRGLAPGRRLLGRLAEDDALSGEDAERMALMDAERCCRRLGRVRL